MQFFRKRESFLVIIGYDAATYYPMITSKFEEDIHISSPAVPSKTKLAKKPKSSKIHNVKKER